MPLGEGSGSGAREGGRITTPVAQEVPCKARYGYKERTFAATAAPPTLPLHAAAGLPLTHPPKGATLTQSCL